MTFTCLFSIRLGSSTALKLSKFSNDKGQQYYYFNFHNIHAYGDSKKYWCEKGGISLRPLEFTHLLHSVYYKQNVSHEFDDGVFFEVKTVGEEKLITKIKKGEKKEYTLNSEALAKMHENEQLIRKINSFRSLPIFESLIVDSALVAQMRMKFDDFFQNRTVNAITPEALDGLDEEFKNLYISTYKPFKFSSYIKSTFPSLTVPDQKYIDNFVSEKNFPITFYPIFRVKRSNLKEIYDLLFN